MNFANNALLKLVLLPKKLYSKNGINAAQLQSIITAKLLIDDRRPAAIATKNSRQKQKKEISKATLATMLVSFIMGCVFLFSFALKTTIVAQLTFYFSYFIFMLSATLISDFTSVLIDIRDNYIILPKPVNDRTILAARLLHIFIHICKLVIPMLLPGLVYMGLYYGVGGCMLLFVLAALAVLFSIFLINAVYIIILRITTPEKFKTIISYIQIAFAVIVYASVQLLPRMFGRMENFDLHFSNSTWLLLLPPYWFAAAWSVTYNLQGSVTEYAATACACFLPFIGLWIVIRFLAPSFNRKLLLISNTANDATPATITGKAVNNRITYSTMFAGLLTKSGSERMGFLFSWYMMARSRDFKMKVYPSVGYILVYFVIMLFNGKSLSLNSIQQQTGGGRFIVIAALYFSGILLYMAVTQLIYSDKYKAAWLYFVTPVAVPGNILNGAVKAAILKFFLPVVIILAIPGVIFAGILFIPNLLLAVINQMLVCYSIVYFNHKELPFSTPQSMKVKTGNFIFNIFRLIIAFAIAVMHYFIYTNLPLLIIFLIVAFTALWLIAGSVKKLSWAAVNTTYKED